MQLTGIHHLTAVSADAPGNLAFYTGTLGMRLVKKTVNQDDVAPIIFFTPTVKASPAAISPSLIGECRRASRRHSITRTGLRVTAKDVARWKDRLDKAGVKTGEIVTRDGRLTATSRTRSRLA